MSPHAYTEDQIVEEATIRLFAARGWRTVSALEETYGRRGTGSRETQGEVVLLGRPRAALSALDSGLITEVIQTVINELACDRELTRIDAAYREICRLLKDVIPAFIPDREHSEQETERLRVVDRARPEQNDFLLVSQFIVVGSAGFCNRISTDASNCGGELLYLSFLEGDEAGEIEQFGVQSTGVSNFKWTEYVAKADRCVSPEMSRSTFREQVVPFFAAVAALGLQIQNLRRTRDLLLSGLFSGLMDVEAMPA
jgi:hypothetical protein